MREIYILCAWWSRPRITRLHAWSMREFISSAPEGYKVKYVAVISPEDKHREELLEIASGFDVVMHSNKLLGDKHNAGVRHILKRIGPDGYLMNIGSDDLIDKSYWDQITAHWGKDMFGISSLYITDEAQTLIYKVNCYIMGAGRLLLADRIRQIGNFSGLELYEPEKQRGLDGSSAKRMAMIGAGYSVICSDKAYILDIKTNVNINKMSTFNGLKKTFAKRKDINHFYPDNYTIPKDSRRAIESIPSNKPIHKGMHVCIYNGEIIHCIIKDVMWNECAARLKEQGTGKDYGVYKFKDLFLP